MAEPNGQSHNNSDVQIACLRPAAKLAELSDRSGFKIALDREIESLEAMRQKESTLRAALVEELRLFAFHTARARFKVETRQIQSAHLDMPFDRVKAADDALIACLEEIAYQELIVADMQRDFDDLALWSVQ